MAATTMDLFRFITLRVRTFILDLISLTDCFGLAMGPDYGHTSFWITYMTNFVGEVRIRLITVKNGEVIVELNVNYRQKYMRIKVSMSVYRAKSRPTWGLRHGTIKRNTRRAKQQVQTNDTHLTLRHSRDGPAYSNQINKEDVFTLLVQPPISPATSFPTKHRADYNRIRRGDQATENARHDPPQRVEGHP